MPGWDKGSSRYSSQFRLPDLANRVPPVHIRAYRDADFDVCCEIYLLNEPGRFPAGYFENFKKTLTDGKSVFLVAEHEGHVRAFGGILRRKFWAAHSFILSYGMAHPQYHGQGLGSAILLARIVAIPKPDRVLFAQLSPVATSRTFYERFGFEKHGEFTGSGGVRFDSHYALFNDSNWQDCHETLINAGVSLDLEQVAVPIESIATPGSVGVRNVAGRVGMILLSAGLILTALSWMARGKVFSSHLIVLLATVERLGYTSLRFGLAALALSWALAYYNHRLLKLTAAGLAEND